MKIYKFVIDILLNNNETTACGIKVKATKRADAETLLEKEVLSIYNNVKSYQITDFRVCL